MLECVWLVRKRWEYREDEGWIIDFCRLNILSLVETRLNKENEVVVEGYKLFGHNRKHLHKKAVRV